MSSSITTPTQIGLAIILWGTNVFVWYSRGVYQADLKFACVFGATISIVVMMSFVFMNLEQLGFGGKPAKKKKTVSEFQKKLHEVELAKQVAANKPAQSTTSAAASCLSRAGVQSTHETV